MLGANYSNLRSYQATVWTHAKPSILGNEDEYVPSPLEECILYYWQEFCFTHRSSHP